MSKQRRQHLFIELQDSRLVQELRSEVAALRAELEVQKRLASSIEMKYGHEVMLSNELIDICRENGVQFRGALNNVYRKNLG